MPSHMGLLLLAPSVASHDGGSLHAACVVMGGKECEDWPEGVEHTRLWQCALLIVFAVAAWDVCYVTSCRTGLI